MSITVGLGDGVQCGGCRVLMYEAIEWNDNEVLDFLLRHGVIRDVAACAKCGRECQLNRLSLEFRCQRGRSSRKQRAISCNWRRSTRLNTFIGMSKLTPKKILRVIVSFLWLKPPRTRLVALNVEISQSTVVDWFSFYREILIEDSIQQSEKLGGPGCIVEIFKAKFGRRKYNRGRRVEGQWVFGGVERGSGRSFLVPVESQDAGTLLTIIKEWVLPVTTLLSDCWKAYNCLEDEGFRHLTVNHTLHFKDPDNIPRFGVRNFHSVGYLAESLFKRKYPDEGERLHHFFLAAAALYPPILD